MEGLSELAVLVVDCQTTGATPALGSVLEVGWGVARGNSEQVEQLQAHWVTLPPGQVVGWQVRRLTGFEEADVTSSLSPQQAWDGLREATKFAERAPAAIHFAKFELAFLRDWAQRFEPEASFPFDAICMHAIACRLYPDLPRRSLRALAGFLGYGLEHPRRCLGHVEATAFIWRKLAAELAARGVQSWDDLRAWLAAPAPPPSRSKGRRFPIASTKYRTLPDEPGVYRFVRSNGDVLYIGKAASLRKRVTSHFRAGGVKTERSLEMLTQVHDIRVTPTGTALEAALLENESIKALHPPYNVQLLGGDAPTWFASANLDTVSPSPDAVHHCGPLPSTFSVRALGAVSRLVCAEPATRFLRARAVETAERWAPDESVFAQGYASFIERHAVAIASDIQEARRSLDAVAKKLIVAAKSESAPDSEAELEGDIAAVGGDPGLWDSDRVLRHLERAVVAGYRLLQRARWLRLVYDSTIVFREPGAERPRMLLVRDGHVVDARDLRPDEAIPRAIAGRPLSQRRGTFDRSQYDRLRTLTSELKRVMRDDGAVAVRIGRTRWLRGDVVDALLFWV